MGKTQHIDRSYNPPFHLHKINNYQKAVYQRKGHWTEKEKVKYGVFLQIFREKFEDRENPILNKMFRIMSDFIKTRNHNQCRSHHQKMERERFQIESILESIRSKYHPREYELFFEKYSRHVRALNIHVVLNEKGFTPHKNVEKRKKKPFNKVKETNDEKIVGQKLEPNDYDQSIKIRKIENQILCEEKKVNHQVNDENHETEKIQVKQEFLKINTDEKHVLPTLSKIEVDFTKENQPKKSQNLKKTGLQYDSDDEEIEADRQKVAYVEIPEEDALFSQRLMMGQNVRTEINPQLEIFSSTLRPPILQNLGLNSFPAPDFQYSRQHSVCPNHLNISSNYPQGIKELDEQKNWHLSEANRLYGEMNEHIHRASLCDQMKEMMMKQMMQLRGGCYFPGQYVNTRY